MKSDLYNGANCISGLFHRAIMQSGSALNPWAYDEPTSARRKAFRLGEILGLKTTDPNELLAFLQNLSAKEIVTGLHKALTDEVMT
jgi:carboxylesterase type B